MPIGTSDGEYFENRFEAMVGGGVSAGLKRVIITKDEGEIPGIDPGDEGMVVHPNQLYRGRELDRFEIDPTTGLGLDIGFKTPLGSPTEPAGALKQEEASRVAPTDSGSSSGKTIYPEPYGLNPPERGPGFERPPRGEPKVLYRTRTGVEITDQDLEDATEAALGAMTTPPSIKNKAYIQMFLDKAEKKPVPYSALKDKPVKPIKSESLGNVSPKEASEQYWNLLTTKGDYSAAKYEHEYWKAQKEGNGYEIFSEHVAKKYKDNPYQQIPFEEAPSRSAQKTVTDKPEDIPGTAEFDKKYGYNQPPVDNTAKALDEIQKLLDEMDKPKGKKVPITESDDTKYWDDYFKKIDEEKKLSPKEAFKQGFQEAKDQLTTDLNIIASKFKRAIKGPPEEIPPPKIQGKGEYTEPAYRGLSIYEQPGNVLNPVYKFTEEGAMYSTAHPQLADMYAGYLNTHPGVKVPEGTFPPGSQVMPLLINTKEYHYFDAKGDIWQKANPKAILEAKDMGKKGVIVDNVWDEPNSTKALAKPNKIYITFPKGAGTVKSRFAEKFDPSDPNILHGIATVGIGTAAGGYLATEEQPPNL